MVGRRLKLVRKMVHLIYNAIRSHQETLRKDFMPVTRFVLRLLSTLKLLPITWSHDDGEFRQYDKHSLQNVVYNISFCFVCVEYFFGIFRLCQAVALNWPLNEGGGALPKVISLFAVMGTKSIVFIGNLNIMLRKKEVANFINRLLRLRRDDNLRSDYPAAKIFFITFSLRAAQMAVVGFVKPNKRNFWYSALPATWKSPWLFVAHVCTNIQTSFMFLTVLFYLINFLLYTETLGVLLQRRARQMDSLWVRLSWYRQLQVLSKLFHKTYGSLAVPYITYHSFIVSVFLAFGSIRYYDILDLRVYIQMPISLFLLLSFDVAFYSRVGNQPRLSVAAIKAWFGNPEYCSLEGRKTNAVCQRSCRLIATARIRRAFFPSLLRFIVFQTTRLLILTSANS